MDLSTSETADPRVVRTRRLLEDALYDLMAEQPYPEITVKDIAARATVNRATFYAHFADKDALFRDLLRNALDRMLAARLGDDHPSLEERLDAILLAVFEHADWLAGECRSAKHGRDAPLPEVELQLYLEQIARDYVGSLEREGGASIEDPETVALAVSAMVARVATAWSRWVERPPLDQMVTRLRAMVSATIEAAPV